MAIDRVLRIGSDPDTPVEPASLHVDFGDLKDVEGLVSIAIRADYPMALRTDKLRYVERAEDCLELSPQHYSKTPKGDRKLDVFVNGLSLAEDECVAVCLNAGDLGSKRRWLSLAIGEYDIIFKNHSLMLLGENTGHGSFEHSELGWLYDDGYYDVKHAKVFADTIESLHLGEGVFCERFVTLETIPKDQRGKTLYEKGIGYMWMTKFNPELLDVICERALAGRTSCRSLIGINPIWSSTTAPSVANIAG